MHEELMNCLFHFWKPLPVGFLTVLQMAESTGRLFLDSQMYSLIKKSYFVIESFQKLKENDSENHVCNSLKS